MELSQNNLYIPKAIWNQLMSALKDRGRNRRESGAFLLAMKKTNAVKEFVCYDDLEANALDTNAVSLTSVAFTKLWAYASENDLWVVADIHTHPSSIVSQSYIDVENPMVSITGHIALIVPHFAKFLPDTLQDVGVYEYLGDYQWKDWTNLNKCILT
jgi:proteasome lid subunit RPN8/RPN11